MLTLCSFNVMELRGRRSQYLLLKQWEERKKKRDAFPTVITLLPVNGCFE